MLAPHHLETLRLGSGLPQLAVDVVTFGAPRVSNAAFADQCVAVSVARGTAVARVENAEDPAPHVPLYLPPSWCLEFRRLCGVSGSAPVSRLAAHIMNVYVERAKPHLQASTVTR